jgi:hypothetical protein
MTPARASIVARQPKTMVKIRSVSFELVDMFAGLVGTGCELGMSWV